MSEDRVRFKRIGVKGEAKLQGRTVGLAGLGSIGSSIAVMLCREGIDLRLIDMGRVEEPDMHRLALFYEEDIMKFKVKQAKARLAAINPKVQVKSFHEEIVEDNVFLLEGDVIIDATNSEAVNALTVPHAAKKKYPLILVRASGSVANILVLHKIVPAKLLASVQLPSVEKDGAFGPATTLAASIVTAETIKILLGDKSNKLITVDGWEQKLTVKKL